MATAPIITRGYGSWGGSALVITRGYTIGEASAVAQIVAMEITYEEPSMEIIFEEPSMEITYDNA